MPLSENGKKNVSDFSTKNFYMHITTESKPKAKDGTVYPQDSMPLSEKGKKNWFTKVDSKLFTLKVDPELVFSKSNTLKWVLKDAAKPPLKAVISLPPPPKYFPL